jgi:hypothetical protein
MRNGQILVFDDMISSSTTAYTSASLYDRLGGHDEIAIIAVIDNVSTSSVGFDLFIEHSCDTRNWLQRNDNGQAFPPPGAATSGDITFSATNTPLLSPNTTYSRMFSDPCTGISKVAGAGGSMGPLLPFVRLAMKLTSGSAHVKVYVVQRDL